MNTASSPPTRRPPLTALSVLALALLLTGACTASFVATVHSRDTARFESQVQMTQDRITAQLDADITLLRGAAGFFAASQTVTPPEFRIYVQRLNLERHDPGIQGLGFSQRIPASQKEAWRTQLQALGLTPFPIWPDAPREEYFPILFLEPQGPRNEAALGFDMFTEPTRRAAMARAWLSGEPALSARLTLERESDDARQVGFLLYVPLYQGGIVPKSEPERRERLEGFIYCVFRGEALFNSMFPPEHQPRVFFRVYDGPEERAETLLYDSALPGEQGSEPPRFLHTSHTTVAGRPWTLAFSSRPDFERALLTPWVPAVAGAGVLFSLLVSAIAWTQIHARQRAEAGEAERARLLAREQAAHAEAEAQRSYLHGIFTQAPAIILMTSGPHHVIEFANAMLRRELGHRELVGKPLRESAPDLSPEALASFDAVYQSGQPAFQNELHLPIVYTSASAEERYWNCVWQPRRGRDGAVDGVLVFAFEVTEQVLARREVEASREEARQNAEKLRVITNTLPVLVAYLDTEERYRFANRAYELWFGVKPERLLGKTVREFIGEQNYARFQEAIRRAISGESVQYEGHLEMTNGRGSDVQVSYIPDRDAQGHVRGFVALAIDITERKRADEAIRNAVRLRDEFLSVASHELKTPLTPLSLKLQALARDAEAQPESPFVLKVRANVEAGRRQLKRLSDLIGDLLDVSRISSGKMKLHWEPVDFASVVREVVARLEPEANKAESQLTVEAPEALAGRSDRMRLEQVAENLLTNAIKYGAGKPIHVRLEASAERLTLSVRDQGIGIAPEHQDRIFERFERAVSDRNYGGLGLGLYITRTIVEALGGSIRVESRLAQGACFTVELPREPVAP